MKNLAKEIRKCKKCDLHKTCTQKVVGRGVARPKVLWIGEAPGLQEDQTGRPFCGPSGQLLDKWMDILNVKGKSAVINCIKCRPPDNRDPTAEELSACRFWMDRQIKLLDPPVIIVLGRFAMKQILSIDKGITGFAGRCFSKEGRKVFVMPHPSYYLRNGGHGFEKPLEGIKNFFKDNIGVTSEPFQDVREEKVIPSFPSFVPLHVHSTYSIGDGCGRIEDLVGYAKELGYKSFALTDHGTVSGLYKFQGLCEEADIKPILGCEFYVTQSHGDKKGDREHLVVLAKNEKGLRNLFRLDTIAHQNYYYKPLITLDDFFENKDGIIASSACVSGILANKLLKGEKIKAYETAEQMKEEFGKDFFIELQYHDFDLQKKVNPMLINLAEDLGIGIVIAPDTHYIHKDDKLAHNVIKAIAYKKKLKDNPGFSSDEYFLPSPKEAYDLSKKLKVPEDIIQEAFGNTVKIADECNCRIEKERDGIPRFKG